jgi:hypothetical protein
MAARLTATLYEDEEAYNGVANDLLMSADRPKPPDLIWNAAANLLSRFVEGRDQKRWSEDLLEMFGIAYAFVHSESWDDLRRDRAVELMDQGLEGVRQQRIRTGDEPISLQNSDQRVTITTLGLAGEHADFAPLRAYVEEQPAYGRIEHLRVMYEMAGIAMAKVKPRHADRFMEHQLLAWRLGLALGLLDLIGEVPESI